MYIDKEIKVLGKNLFTIRKQHNLSLIQMSKVLKINVFNLFMLEKGILLKGVNVNIIFIIHSAFGVLPKNLFIPSGVVKDMEKA